MELHTHKDLTVTHKAFNPFTHLSNNLHVYLFPFPSFLGLLPCPGIAISIWLLPLFSCFTLSLLCIKRPVIRHKVQFLLHSSVQAARLPAAQSWNQSPNPETLKPSGRVRQRRKRHTSTWRGRQKECRWTWRQKSLVWIK